MATTIKVETETADAFRAMAEDTGLTHDELLGALVDFAEENMDAFDEFVGEDENEDEDEEE
jgi:hypothetical protein